MLFAVGRHRAKPSGRSQQLKRASARAAVVTVLSSGTLMGGFGVFAISTPAADAKPGGGSGGDNDHDHGLGGAIHKITGGLLGGGSGGGGGPGSGGTRSAPSSPSFGKSLHGGSGSESAAGSSGSSDSSKGDKDKDKGPGANVPKPGSAGSSGNSSEHVSGNSGSSTIGGAGSSINGSGSSTSTSGTTGSTSGVGIGGGTGITLPHSGGTAGAHTPNAESPSVENPSGTTTHTEESPTLKGALGSVAGAMAPKTQTATTPKADTATSPHNATAPGATAGTPAPGTHTEHETSAEEPKVPGVTLNVGGRTIIIWKKKPSTSTHTPGAGGGTTHDHETTHEHDTTHDHEGEHSPVITLPGLPNLGGIPNPDAPFGGAAGTRTPGGNPGIHTGPIAPPTVPTPKAPAVAIAAPPAPPVIAPLAPVVPPAPPVVTIKQAEGGRGGDAIVTAGGTKQPEAVTKPIEQFVAAETIAPRTGYGDYLRLTKTSEIAAVAIPGAVGIAMMTFVGGAIGYRQAKAGHTVRASAAARFLE
ncbi:Uncharacterised protein [Mycolicibacterium phlei]|nr:Uncharacterised protein [Mycolicibacterium phlei]